ncbi:MAG: type II secretion system minor pseudopilin GspK [Nevskia sp.]
MAVRCQRGIALVTAMFVVALSTIAAVAMFESANIAVHRASNLVESESAYWYALGVESWVKGILKEDARRNQIDGLGDIWAKPVDFLPIDNGSLRGRVEDLQGRFNLNNLATPDPAQLKAYLVQFQRLLDNLPDFPADKYRGVGSAIRDWVDADSERFDLNGAEDNDYQGLDPPHRAANRPMTSASELLQVRGITPELYGALRPYVTALPTIGTRVNVNTAPEPVLRSLSANIDASALQSFLRSREAKPLESSQEAFSGKPGAQGGGGGFLSADKDTHPEHLIDVKSRYFELQAEVFIGSSRVALYSVYVRPDGADGNPVVIAHSTDVD